ncbi:MAG: TCP-1/cpn60 chaperonin family protein [Paenibacillaceae bacterium]
MSQAKQGNHEGEERYATLLNNAGAIRAICAAVEGTLGPKGLDTMLVGTQGEVMITNDGVTILEKMDVTHPAARLMVQVARSQQAIVGDGTTTATVLAGALVSEGVAQVMKGVPVAKVVRGMEQGIQLAMESLQSRSRYIAELTDPILYRIAFTAGREHKDIADLVIEAAKLTGVVKLKDESFRFSAAVTAVEKARNEVWQGILLHKKPMHPQLQRESTFKRVLVLQDALEPEAIDEEALATESGFRASLEMRGQFIAQLECLIGLEVGLISVERSVDAEAEQFCADHGILLVQRLTKSEILQLCEYTGAKPVRRSALKKASSELASNLGAAGNMVYDDKIGRIRLSEGEGKPLVTLIVGASTQEIVGERSRIAMDAAAALQAALYGGYLPGGGAAEIAAAHELDRYRESLQGMEGFGISAVSQALRKPLAQIVMNAGYNPLEKVEEIKAAQLLLQTDSLGIDCDTGKLIDCLEAGIVDPTPVKLHALQAAGEVAGALLRIHTVIKMKSNHMDDAE